MVSPKKLMDNRRIGMKILLMKKVWRRKHFWNTEYIPREVSYYLAI